MPYAREVRCLGRGVLLAQQIRSKAKVGEKLLKISSGFKTDWNRPDFVKRLTHSHGTVPFVLPKSLGLCYWAWLLAVGCRALRVRGVCLSHVPYSLPCTVGAVIWERPRSLPILPSTALPSPSLSLTCLLLVAGCLQVRQVLGLNV